MVSTLCNLYGIFNWYENTLVRSFLCFGGCLWLLINCFLSICQRPEDWCRIGRMHLANFRMLWFLRLWLLTSEIFLHAFSCLSSTWGLFLEVEIGVSLALIIALSISYEGYFCFLRHKLNSASHFSHLFVFKTIAHIHLAIIKGMFLFYMGRMASSKV